MKTISLRLMSTASSIGDSPSTFRALESAPRFMASRAAPASPRLIASKSASLGVISLGSRCMGAAPPEARAPGSAGGGFADCCAAGESGRLRAPALELPVRPPDCAIAMAGSKRRPTAEAMTGGSGVRRRMNWTMAACYKRPPRAARPGPASTLASHPGSRSDGTPDSPLVRDDIGPGVRPAGSYGALATRPARSSRPSRRSPATTPARSSAGRFWLIFTLPSSRLITRVKPTMPRSIP